MLRDSTFSHRGEAAFRKHLRDHDQKAALSGEVRKKINLELAKTRLHSGLNMRPTAVKIF